MQEARGLPRGPNMRMGLFGWVPIASPSFSKPTSPALTFGTNDNRDIS
jgi:hypothetical protein